MTAHRWDIESEQRIPASDSKDGCSRNVKGCSKMCGTFKITIIAGNAADNEWIGNDGKVYRVEPPCIGREPQEVKAL